MIADVNIQFTIQVTGNREKAIEGLIETLVRDNLEYKHTYTQLATNDYDYEFTILEINELKREKKEYS